MGVDKNLLPAPGFELRIHSVRRESLRLLCNPGCPTLTGAPFFSSTPADSGDSSFSCRRSFVRRCCREILRVKVLHNWNRAVGPALTRLFCLRLGQARIWSGAPRFLTAISPGFSAVLSRKFLEYWDGKLREESSVNTHTNIATYTNQKPRFNTVIQKLQMFDTSAYYNRRRVQPEDLPTRDPSPHPPNTKNSGHQNSYQPHSSLIPYRH